MYGNIIGDLAGSIYEYGQAKKVSHITVDKLIKNDSFISDDTILTIAIIDAIVNNKAVLTDAREGAKTVAVCLAIVESSVTGKAVKPDYNF